MKRVEFANDRIEQVLVIEMQMRECEELIKNSSAEPYRNFLSLGQNGCPAEI